MTEPHRDALTGRCSACGNRLYGGARATTCHDDAFTILATHTLERALEYVRRGESEWSPSYHPGTTFGHMQAARNWLKRWGGTVPEHPITEASKEPPTPRGLFG